MNVIIDDVEYDIDYSDDQVRNVMLRHIEHLEQQLAAERERADFAWQNTRIIEAARQEEMRLRDEEREACAELCDRFAARDMHPAECAAAIRGKP